MSDNFRYVGLHIGDLADGRTVEPGQTVKLDKQAADDPHNARLIEDGQLLAIPETKKESEK